MAGTSFIELLRTLDPDPHIRGKQFERLTKWWLTNTPVTPFAPLAITNLWLWDEWPDRHGPDIGIDLVAELSDGSLCAVQAKCIDENADIPKSQLDSFISAASTKIYSHRLLIASTDGLSTNARRMLQDQHVIRVMRTELETSLTAWPASINDLDAPVTQEKWKPLPHQGEAITNVTTGLASVDRGQMIMACGTGKTLTALWITEALNPTTTLVLVPSLNLLSQTLFEWARHTTSAWTYICVCSDDTVNKNNDEPITTVDDFPFEVTTDPTRIATFLTTSGRKVIFSTYQSSAQIATALRTSPTAIDLAICDEAHRLTGKTDADYATILDNTKIPTAKRLFMTATPRTYTPTVKKRAEERGVEVTSMDDEAIYGPVLHKLSFGEAISRGLLSDYKVVIVGVTDPQVQELIDRRELVTVNNDVDTDARTLAAHIGLAKATKDYNLARTISFHSRINTAAKFAQDHPKILNWLPDTHRPDGTTWTDTISGAMNTGQRRRLLNQLRIDQPDRHALLTNARCLTEGVDVPTLDGIAFIDPRSSQVDIIQAVGRAIRKTNGKETGFIVLPVLIPTTADLELALEDTAFKPIWAILNALKAHDNDLAESLSTLRTELGRTGDLGTLPEQIAIELHADINTLDAKFVESLRVSIVDRTTSSWDWWLGLLQDYVSRSHGKLPTKDENYRGRNLGAWVSNQRFRGRSGLLTPKEALALEGVSGWVWSVHEDSWTRCIELFKQFVQSNGHGRIPVSYTVNDVPLGQWVASRRNERQTGSLEREKEQELQSLDGWIWDVSDYQWHEKFAVLEQFVQDHGHARPPAGRQFRGHNLGSWVAAQRKLNKAGELSPEQHAKLASLSGWTWNPSNGAWNSGIDSLRDFVSSYGRLPRLGEHTDPLGKDLAKWTSRQRSSKASLDDEQIRQLEEIPGWTWDIKVAAWDKSFTKLVEFAEENGHIELSITADNSERKLYHWVQRQRIQYASGKLAGTRINSLESLESLTTARVKWYWTREDQDWEAGLAALRSFSDREGHCRVPFNHIEGGFPLSQWIYVKRNSYRNKTSTSLLSPNKIKELESIPGWTWAPLEHLWTSTYASVREHILLTGDAHASADRKLRTWIQNQKRKHEDNELSPYRAKLLEDIPGWTWERNIEPWDRAIEVLQDFVRTHNRLPRHSDKHADFSIGSWCVKQRTDFERGQLPRERIERLEAVDYWTWQTAKQSRWGQGLNALQSFVLREGHCRIPTPWIENGFRLDTWVIMQRRRHEAGWISRDEQKLLEDTQGWTWKPAETEWTEGVEAARAFSMREGHTAFSRQHHEGSFPLGAWARRVRIAYFKNDLTPSQIQTLESIPGWRWHRRRNA